MIRWLLNLFRRKPSGPGVTTDDLDRAIRNVYQGGPPDMNRPGPWLALKERAGK